MNILFISNDPGIFIEGTPVRARMRAYTAALVAQQGAGSTLHILSRAKKTETILDGALVLHGVRVGALGALLSFPRIARTLIRTEHIAVVSAQDPFEYGWISSRAVQGTSAKLHIQIHTDFLSPWFVRGGMMRAPTVPVPVINKIRRRLAAKVLPQAAGIRVVSERIKQSLIATYGLGMERVAVIPIYVGGTLPEPVALPAHACSFALLTVSRLEPEKRIEDILEAIASIRQTYPAVGLFIVGEGRERARLEGVSRRLGLSECVQFLGWRTDSWGLMRSAQAYIQASAYEGYGLTLLEAALAQVPIITTDVGIVGEVFEGYEDVLAVPVGDPAALATAIKGLVEDNQIRMEYAENAHKKALLHLEAQYDQPARIIKDICEAIA